MRHSVLITTFLLALTGWFLLPSSVLAESSNFRLCIVNERLDQPNLALKQYTDLHACLKKRLAEKNIHVDRLIIAKSVNDLSEKIQRGEVDAFIEGIMPTFEVERDTGKVDPQLIVWRKGQRQYYTVFFVRKESSIKHLEDLAGHTIAFESPRSTSAYYLPRITLLNHGLKTVPAGPDAPTDAVQYLFADSEPNQAYWVQRGKTEAGAFNDGDWQRTPSQIREELRIIHQTKPLLRWLFSFVTTVKPHVRQAVNDILVRMHESEEGQSALHKAVSIARFERLSEADRKNLDHWRKFFNHTGLKK
jgi:ABC-type phosphate/phosphonate transport system substrate-binding protein